MKTNEKDLKKKIELLENDNIEKDSMINNLENMLAQARSDYEKVSRMLEHSRNQVLELEGKIKLVTETVTEKDVSLVSQVTSLTKCADCLKLVGKIDQLIDLNRVHEVLNRQMSRENGTLQVHYVRLIKEEKQYNSKIEAFRKDNDELKRTFP